MACLQGSQQAKLVRSPAGLNDGMWADVDLLYGTSFICLVWGSGAGWVDAGLRLPFVEALAEGNSHCPVESSGSLWRLSNRPVFQITLCKAGLHERRGPQGV